MRLVNASLLTYHPFVSRDHADAFLLSLPPIDFQIDAQYQIQAEAVVQAKRLPFQFQSVYLDASAITTGTTYLTIGTTGQIVAIRPGSQGYRPLVCNPGAQTFTLTNTGANAAGTSQILNVIFLNIPVVGTEWAASAGASPAAATVWG
jgi:hypothetical protein